MKNDNTINILSPSPDDFINNNISTSLFDLEMFLLKLYTKIFPLRRDKTEMKKKALAEKQTIQSVIKIHMKDFNDSEINSRLARNKHKDLIHSSHNVAQRRYIDKYIGRPDASV